MSPFETHGIQHLSPSSLNTWAAAPGVWIMERLLGRKTPVGAAAHRGTAAEDGIVFGLMNPDAPLAEAQEIAGRRFRELTALSSDPRRDKEADGLDGIVDQGIRLMRPWGKPTKTQGKVSWTVDGIEVPIIGFYDALYEDHGLLVDFKTQLALSSSIKVSHARQVALYKATLSDNMTAGIAYCTPKKAHMLALENHREHLAALVSIAHSLRRFLSLSADPHELAGLLSVDVESFYLADPRARQHAFEVFAI